MFSTTALTSLILGVLYVNASALPVTREPSPEPDCEFPPSFPTIPYRDLTMVSNSPGHRSTVRPSRRHRGRGCLWPCQGCMVEQEGEAGGRARDSRTRDPVRWSHRTGRSRAPG